MAQVLKLKRTAVQGKVPTTSNLELGELAINTYDGRLFFEKDNGDPTVEEIVTTGAQISGSINIQFAVTASHFVGDGSGLTNLPAVDVSQVSTVTSSFSNQSTVDVNHNFDSKNIIVSVYDTNDSQLIPQSVSLTDNNNVSVTLSDSGSGFVVVAKGGHIVSGSAADSNNLNGQGGSYYLDYTNFTSIPSGIVSGSTQITDLTTYKEEVSGSLSYAVSHSLNEEYPIVQAWNTSTKKQEIPSEIESTSPNSLTITFNSTFSGKIIVKK